MLRSALGFLAVLALLGCERTEPGKHHANTEAVSKSSVSVSASAAVSTSSSSLPPAGALSAGANAAAKYHGGDAAHGKTLITQFECNRCHEVQAFEPAARDKHCVRCHDDISKGKFPAPASALARWRKSVDAYTVNPSLVNVGARFEPDWLYGFLLDPFDLRPHLATSMPKLALTEQDAADLVAYFTSAAKPAESAALLGNPEKGRQLMDQKSCGSCHEFSGVPPFMAHPDPKASDEQQKRAIRLAPDLRFARQRYRPGSIVAWLRDPKSLKGDTLMPSHSLDAKEAADIAAYVLQVELAPVPPRPIPARLPVLQRKVAFQEVMDKVLGITCRHCHSDPDASLGDGGPGNTGGFGFKPKGLDLATYRGVAAGYLDEKGERTSVFLPLDDGTPRLVAALLARQKEEAGQRDARVRGMPLGLPALTPEQIQLVESWVAQGRPR